MADVGATVVDVGATVTIVAATPWNENGRRLTHLNTIADETQRIATNSRLRTPQRNRHASPNNRLSSLGPATRHRRLNSSNHLPARQRNNRPLSRHRRWHQHIARPRRLRRRRLGRQRDTRTPAECSSAWRRRRPCRSGPAGSWPGRTGERSRTRRRAARRRPRTARRLGAFRTGCRLLCRRLG